MDMISGIPEALTKIGKNRIILLIFLILILTGLCLYYVENFKQHEDYPTGQDLLSSYPEGQLVSVSGSVIQTFPGGFVMVESYHNVLFQFIVYSPEKVSPHDQVSVLGVLLPNYQIISQKMLIGVDGSFSFVLIRSFLAFLVLFLIFFHYWKFNWEKLIFERRKK